ncbi:molecular chaperone Hsp70 [Actinophytocola xinjiangensis]|uniref:Molecular chaperone Hsp70 n=1 Tax=Actinophytocola xinjiangensis TaxID=485602 RepID=A0A7Z0WDM8_9PSEU|nr:Hsp70 family protein [Actinophytocola xinjiangensis]OLF04326.1 molecular chaperone Hsp70 [Actinophytocola xinjiangensis]
MNVLSVDLGTSNTVAVLAAHGRPPRVVDVDGASMMPSAVFADDDGALVVGRDAERRARLDPARYEPNPKRRVDEGTLLLGDQVVPVTDALAGVLRRVVDETSRQLGGAKPDEVRLTHPAQWGPVRRNVLLSAARQAGMGANLVLVPEPVAAAAHFASFPGQTLVAHQALAVYDLGAGTFDVAIVGATQKGFVVLAEAGLPDLGGLDVDQALLEHVGRQVSHKEPARWQSLLRPVTTADRRAQRALREDVKAAKESLSRHPQTEVPLPEPFDDVLVTRLELEALIRPGLLRSVELLAGTIRSTGMTADRLVGIYLVGGSSRIPLIATLIAEQLKVVPTSLDQPETAVALGAHHVPQEGVTMRTSDISNTIEDVQRTARVVTPRAAFPTPAATPTLSPSGAPAAPVPSAFPASGPQRLGPPSGPQPLPQPPPPPPPVNFGPPPVAKRSAKPWYIASGVIAVVVIAVVTVLIVTSGGGGGGDTTASCASNQPDDQGFSECMRQLAGSVPEHNECQKGAINPLNADNLGAPNTTSATCTMADDHTVIYMHFGSSDSRDGTQNAQEYIDTFNQEFEAVSGATGDQNNGTWDGDGLNGSYTSIEAGGVGLLIFSVDDSPVLGVLIRADLTGSGSSSITDFYDQHVKPGSDGGA